MENHESFADRMIKQTLNHVLTGGIDEDMAEDTILELQKALQSQAKALAHAAERVMRGDIRCETCHQPTPPHARDVAHLTKALDECARLLQFAKGGPDHRTAVSISSEERGVLRYLTAAQVESVSAWVEEGMIRLGEER